MTVTVELLAGMDRGRGPIQVTEVPDGTDIEGLMKRLHVSREIVGFIAINGKLVNPQTILREGDVVKIVPLVDGG